METPPLTRGRLTYSNRVIIDTRNTPAYAGKTAVVRVVVEVNRNTPAYAGKTTQEASAASVLSETPPLTRGRPRYVDRLLNVDGNTPAYAGKTVSRRSRSRRGWKHPRLRGEDSGRKRRPHAIRETPPLTRGRPQPLPHAPERVGNTPAYAGKTWRVPSRACSRRKHPRLRGEDCTSGSFWMAAVGNTPAYAGKTVCHACGHDAHAKHPRLRGEDSAVISIRRKIVETPPLTRGRRKGSAETVKAFGNTPAYAGKTASERPPPGGTWKHPRLRGEDFRTTISCARVAETPPLTRGRQQHFV